MEFNRNDQVIVRRQMRNGKLVRMGSVLSIDGDKALIHFPIDHTKAIVPVSQLEKTSETFGGYARVQVSAMRRSIAQRKGLV